MAMNKNLLGQLMQTKMQGVSPRGESETFDAYQLRVFTALADAIVSHITSNAEVTTYVGPADAGLQTYTVPPAPPVPTAPNPALPPTGIPLSNKGTVA
jgi:hypothetical protein